MQNKRVVIVGGGTAGWMTAAFLSKYYGKNNSITVVESPSVPKIGVGESITAHVNDFFRDIGANTHEWMKHTGAVYKFANKFTNWKTGNGETQYSGFNFSVQDSEFYKDITPARVYADFASDPTRHRSPDYAFDLCERGVFTSFDQCFHPQYHYMEKNVAPFNNGEPLLNAPYSDAQHINAELAGVYIKDHIAIPAGVKHIVATVTDIDHEGSVISSITLNNGDVIQGDLFIDCTGFSKILVKKLGWEEKFYEHNPIDSAWVCHSEYDDLEKEMVNYTQSIAEPYGWRFAISLYHHMGNGYCFSSKHISDEEALDYFIKQIGPQRYPPRLIKWKPSRLKKFGEGNVAAVGLSTGFVEPLEANSLFIIINSVRKMADVLGRSGDTGIFDWTPYTEVMSEVFENIADFILVHYTLSSRDDTEFWRDMVKKGRELNHQKLLWDSYYSEKNTMHATAQGVNFYPDMMWAQLASYLGIPKLDQTPLDKDIQWLAENHFKYTENKHRYISDTRQNNYHWLKENVFENLSPAEWEKKYIKK